MKNSIQRRAAIVMMAVVLLLSACQGKEEPKTEVKRWCMEDLKFYNYLENPVESLNQPYTEINLTGELQTYRGVMLGDNAVEALSKYNLEEASYTFAGTHENFDATWPKAEELTKKYEGVSAAEMLNRIDEIPDFGGIFYYTLEIYMNNKELYYKSELKDEYDYDYLFEYTVYIKNQKIDDLTIRFVNTRWDAQNLKRLIEEGKLPLE